LSDNSFKYRTLFFDERSTFFYLIHVVITVILTENGPSKDGHCLDISSRCCHTSWILKFVMRQRGDVSLYQTALKCDRYTFYVLLRASQYRASGSVHPSRPPLLPGTSVLSVAVHALGTVRCSSSSPAAFLLIFFYCLSGACFYVVDLLTLL
jgi:hypothetical protein